MKTIKILGSGCAKCNKLYDLSEKAAKELGVEYKLEKVSDINKITELGVMMTPALVVDGDVKISGKVPSFEDVKNMIK
ncbi:MAG: thioredoxin family protein [Spirochaetota bacterium]|nr:thioredoxin family protein [Spirochaetota bacterium]